MSRYLFVSDVVLRPATASAQLSNGQTATPLVLAANQPFTLWTDLVGGTQITDCTAPDGVTALPLTGGSFTADGIGQPTAFRGPNGIPLLYIDNGGPTRYALAAVDLLKDVLTAGIGWLVNSPGSAPGASTIGGVTGLNDALNAKADLVQGVVRRTQLPFNVISRTAEQGVPTPAECAALGYPDGCLISVDPA